MAEVIPTSLGTDLGGDNDEFLPSWLVSLESESENDDEFLPSWLVLLESESEQGKLEQIDSVTEEFINMATSKENQEGDFVTVMQTELRKHESPNFGYNDYYRRGDPRGGPVAPPKELTEMTVNEVSAWQVASNPPGKGTSAAGAYQIINKTLKGLIRIMGLTGDELFSTELQDEMSLVLMKGRGLDRFLSGKTDRDTFANEMAKEWASLPVLKPTQRGSRTIDVGESYYKGDGVNQAFKGEGKFEAYQEVYALVGVQ